MADLHRTDRPPPRARLNSAARRLLSIPGVLGKAQEGKTRKPGPGPGFPLCCAIDAEPNRNGVLLMSKRVSRVRCQMHGPRESHVQHPMAAQEPCGIPKARQGPGSTGQPGLACAKSSAPNPARSKRRFATSFPKQDPHRSPASPGFRGCACRGLSQAKGANMAASS